MADRTSAMTASERFPLSVTLAFAALELGAFDVAEACVDS
jgi:hypothetical protein